MKEELENLARSKHINFKVYFSIDIPEDNWEGGVGYISKEMICANLPEPADDTIMLMCGPPVMCQKVLTPILNELGHNKEDIFEF